MNTMTKKDAVILEYVTWMLKEGKTLEQKYLDYLDKIGLLKQAIKDSLGA